MDVDEQLLKFNLVVWDVTANQHKSKLEDLHTVVSFILNSNSQGRFITPYFHLCGSEQMCYIKMEFNDNRIDIALIHKFEETVYHVRPTLSSLMLIKDGEIEKLPLIKSNFLWSSIKHRKYFNSIGYFEILFMFHYIIYAPVHSLLVPKKSVLYDCLLNMYMERKFTDVELIVENKKYVAHKSILARSPVFEAMFQHEMREKYQEVVTINGIESEIFDIILKFLYVGEIDDINGIVKFDNNEEKQCKLESILKAADMYQIEDMKVVLGYIASKFINLDNVAYYFVIATEYNTQNLRYSCVSFIKTYGKLICNNKKFKDIITANPTVAFQLINCLLD